MLHDVFKGFLAGIRIPHNASFPDLSPPRLELRLYEQNQIDVTFCPLRLESLSQWIEDLRQRDKGEIGRNQRDFLREVARSEIAYIKLIADYNPRVRAELPGDLSPAHIKGVHLARPALQQAVGKTTRAGTEVRANTT